MDEPVKSILQMRDPQVIDTGFNPIADLKRFTREAEARRQTSMDEVEKAKYTNSKWIDVSEPVKVESTLPAANTKGKLQPRFPEEGGEGADYDWKIGAGEEPETWTIAEGHFVFHGQGDDLTVEAGTVAGASGVIYVQISRDPASRAASSPSYGLAATLPEATQEYQYFELGVVGGTPSIIQGRFGPIRLYEDLFVVNGEFRLGNIQMAGNNLYALPIP